MGTSTSSMGETEDAYAASGRARPVSRPHPGAEGPHAAFDWRIRARSAGADRSGRDGGHRLFFQCQGIRSSRAHVRLGLVDAAVVGGVDTLCGSILFGFNACRWCHPSRAGLSMWRAMAQPRRGGGFALLERGPGGLQLWGYGESSDAHHMSTPHPEGLGAERALDDALARAAVPVDEIDYINLHGTASQKNDEVEAALVARKYSPPHPRQFDQGLGRPHAGCCGHPRSGDQPVGG